MDLTRNTGVIQDGKAGPDDWTVLENSGNQALFKLKNGNLKERELLSEGFEQLLIEENIKPYSTQIKITPHKAI